MASPPKTKDIPTILIICDSRGKLLHNYFKTVEYNTIVKAYSGARIYHSVKLAETEIKRWQPDQIYLLAGVNNITQLDRVTRKVSLVSMDKDKIIQHFEDEMNFSYTLIKKTVKSETKVIFAPVTGMDLEKYNKAETGSLLESQSVLNETIVDVNNLIITQNTNHKCKTPWTHGIVHRYFRGRYHFMYDRLDEDGCHLTDQIREYWGKKIATAIIANS